MVSPYRSSSKSPDEHRPPEPGRARLVALLLLVAVCVEFLGRVRFGQERLDFAIIVGLLFVVASLGGGGPSSKDGRDRDTGRRES